MRFGQFGGGWSVFVAGSLVTLSALAADPPPPAAKPARAFSAQATFEAVQSLLLEQWEAPAGRIKRMGSITLVRASRKHADLAAPSRTMLDGTSPAVTPRPARLAQKDRLVRMGGKSIGQACTVKRWS